MCSSGFFAWFLLGLPLREFSQMMASSLVTVGRLSATLNTWRVMPMMELRSVAAASCCGCSWAPID